MNMMMMMMMMMMMIMMMKKISLKDTFILIEEFFTFLFSFAILNFILI